MRRGPDQSNHAALHVRQKDILLGPVEPVDFVDEQQCRVTRVLQSMPRPLQHPPKVRHRRFHAVEPLELHPRAKGDQLRQRRLSRTRRAKQDQRLDSIGFQRPTQQLPWTQNVGLTGVFLERSRPHPGCQGCRTGRRGFTSSPNARFHAAAFCRGRGSKEIGLRHDARHRSGKHRSGERKKIPTLAVKSSPFYLRN